MCEIIKFFSSSIWNGVGVVYTILSPLIIYFVKKIYNEKEHFKNLFKYKDLANEFESYQEVCSAKLKNYSKLATEIKEIDSKFIYDTRDILLPLVNIFNFFIDKDESRMINKILKDLDDTPIGKSDLSSNLLSLSSKISRERRYLH